MSMNWQTLYEVTLERVKQLNKEVSLLQEILRSYLPILEKEEDETR